FGSIVLTRGVDFGDGSCIEFVVGLGGDAGGGSREGEDPQSAEPGGDGTPSIVNIWAGCSPEDTEDPLFTFTVAGGLGGNSGLPTDERGGGLGGPGGAAGAGDVVFKGGDGGSSLAPIPVAENRPGAGGGGGGGSAYHDATGEDGANGTYREP